MMKAINRIILSAAVLAAVAFPAILQVAAGNPAVPVEEDLAFFEKKYSTKFTGVKPKGEYDDPGAFYSAIGQQLGIPEIALMTAAALQVLIADSLVLTQYPDPSTGQPFQCQATENGFMLTSGTLLNGKPVTMNFRWPK